MNNNTTICNSSVMYQCYNSSKCIPISYIDDGIRDCDYEDDEQQFTVDQVCPFHNNTKVFYKCANENKCIHRRRLADRSCDCQKNDSHFCDDEKPSFWKDVDYKEICDGDIHNQPIVIDGQIHTDETECEQWPCVNRQTKCNDVWDCPNGADELDCYASSSINCSSKQHICVSPQTNEFICLPLEKANDNVTDCLGGIDESTVCARENLMSRDIYLYCQDDNSSMCWTRRIFCVLKPKCDNGNMTKYCELSIKTRSSTHFNNRFNLKSDTKLKLHSSMIHSSEKYYCHYGLPLQVLLNKKKNMKTKACLCPPSYYGDRCQYQNQRVSLMIEIQIPATSIQTPFVIVVSLIDTSDQRMIHSYWQSPLRSGYDKQTFNIQLVYSRRPKDSSKQYFIHIDIYETISLRYRGSLLALLKFPFLPVERVAVEVNIPKIYDTVQSCINNQCIHGQCVHYLNELNSYFCRCQSGWIGKYCDIPHTCTCSSDSFCAGMTANNRSICVCPLHKFGSKCLLSKKQCQPNYCLNGGTCASRSYYIPFSAEDVCICPKGFNGERCENIKKKMFITLDQNIQLSFPSQIFLYFIDLNPRGMELQVSSSAIVCNDKYPTINYFPTLSHIVIIHFSSSSQLYLIENDTINYDTSTGNVTVDSSYHCPSIHQVFNANIAQMDLIRRIKYYNVPCQNRSSNLRCFHDDLYVCLCQNFSDQRLADCVKLESIFKRSDPQFTYNEMKHLCFTNNQTDFSTYSTFSTRSLTSVISNQSNTSTSSINRPTLFNSAFNIFILLFCLCIH